MAREAHTPTPPRGKTGCSDEGVTLSEQYVYETGLAYEHACKNWLAQKGFVPRSIVLDLDQRQWTAETFRRAHIAIYEMPTFFSLSLAAIPVDQCRVPTMAEALRVNAFTHFRKYQKVQTLMDVSGARFYPPIFRGQVENYTRRGMTENRAIVTVLLDPLSTPPSMFAVCLGWTLSVYPSIASLVTDNWLFALMSYRRNAPLWDSVFLQTIPSELLQQAGRPYGELS